MTTPNVAPQTARQQLVQVTGIPGYMATKTGGDRSADTTSIWDGGAVEAEKIGGPADTSNVTVTKPYRATIHGPILKTFSKQVGRLRTTVKIFDTDPDLGPVGQPIVYANALLVGLKRPELDAASSDGAMFELEFAVSAES